MRVVYLTPELAPLAKTGGLADVAASLPAALADLGVEMTVMLPLYRSVRESGVELRPLEPPAIEVQLGPYALEVGLEGASVSPPSAPNKDAQDSQDGERRASCPSCPSLLTPGRVRVVCLRYDPYFDRAEPYGEGGQDYPDNCRRFSLFARAAMVAAEALDLRPDIFHANDWQSALVCAYVSAPDRDTQDSQDGELQASCPSCPSLLTPGGDARARSLFTIHNMAYQGTFWKWDLPWTGLGWEHFTVDGVEFYGRVNLLKAGIVFADAVSTVSPTYAREIQESSECGAGLEGVLKNRAASVFGILNGIDADRWNPETDTLIPANYSARDLTGKAECKAALRREVGLAGDADAPLLGSIGRLAEQKGMALVVEAADDLLALEAAAELVVLGTGEEGIARDLAALEARYPHRIRFRNDFDEGLAHRIEAGSDIFLMPSRYEPCGLNQLYSMRYGTIPVVHGTGGLADTVEDTSSASVGTGFVFDEFGPDALVSALRRALARYRDREAWRGLVRRAMARDWSWGRSAAEYLGLYKRMLRGRAVMV